MTNVECIECLDLTKALQKTSESLQSIADLYDDHVRDLSIYEGLITDYFTGTAQADDHP